MRKAIQYTKDLESVGLTREQAEAHLRILDEIVEDDVAKKSDLTELKNEVKIHLQEFRSEVDFRFQELRSEMDSRFQELRSEMDSRFQELRSEMDSRFQEQRSEMNARFNEVGTEFKQIRQEMLQLEYRLIVKLGTITVAAITLINGLFVTFLRIAN